MNSEKKLFTDKFVKVLDSRDYPSSKKEEFKRYYEKRKEEQKRQDILENVETLRTSLNKNENDDVYSELSSFKKSHKVPFFTDSGNIPGNSGGVQGKSPEENIKIEKSTIVSIDTKDRDIDKYPKQNNFRAFLGKTFMNVKKIELLSTEFPNTDQVIKELPVELQNNLISWQNEEDYDLNFFTGLLINTVVSDTIDIILEAHGYDIGQFLNVVVYNSKLDSESNPSGIIDGKRRIKVIDKDTFRFDFTGGISGQGVASLDLGFPIYQVAVKPGNYTASSLASQIQKDLRTVKRRNGVGQFHFFEVKVNLDTDVMILDSVFETQLPNNSISTTAGSTTITVNQLGHGFKSGDRVKLIGVKSFAGINASDLNGDFITNVSDFNTFSYEINVRATETVEGGGNTIKTGKDAPFRLLFDTTNTRIQFNTGFPNEDSGEAINSINPITTKSLNISTVDIISANQIRITTPQDHGLRAATKRQIVSIDSGSPPIVTTLTPHGIELPSIVTLRNTNTSPKLNGSFLCVPTGDFTFVVQSATIPVSGTGGDIIYGNDKIKLFNLRTVPNILLDPVFYVENVPLSNKFDITFRAESITQSSIPNAIIGTSQVSINHPGHGFNILSSITYADVNFANIQTFLKNNFIGSRVPNVSIEGGPEGTNTVDIILTNHGIETSDLITIIDSNTDPIINGVFRVQVVDTDTLRINFVFSTFTDGTGTILTGDKVTLSNTKSIPRIDGVYSIDNRKIISNITTGVVSSIITTTQKHNSKVGDVIEFSQTNSTPLLTGEFTIETIINNFSFEISLEQDIVNTGTFGIMVNKTRFVINTGFDIITPGSNPCGITGRSLEVDHYRIVPNVEGSDNIADINLRTLNGVKRPIEKLIDENNYMLIITEQYANDNITGGGSNVIVSSEKHGFRSIQANTSNGKETGDLFRSISLEGENYVYMVAESEGASLGTVLNTANIQNTFAKILLSESPGNLMFNSFVSEPKVFDNPISKLNYMRFQILTPSGFRFNFNDIDYSFTVRVTEIVDQLKNSFVSSQTGGTEFSKANLNYKNNNNKISASSTDISKAKSNRTRY